MRNDSQGRSIQIGRYKPAPLTLNLSVISASIQLNINRHYRFWSSVDAFFDTGPTNAVTATTSSHPLTGKLDVLHYTDDTNVWLAGVVSTGTGVLYISEIDAQ